MKLIISIILLFTSLSLMHCYSDDADKRINKCVNLCSLVFINGKIQCGADTICVGKATDAWDSCCLGCGAF